MTSVLETRYDRTTTQLLRDALKRSHEDARSIGLGIGTIEDPRSSSSDTQYPRLEPEEWVAVLDHQNHQNFAAASFYLADVCSSLGTLVRAGRILSLVSNPATAGKPTVEQEWEREEDWQRLFM
jgi:hypothetical protein